MSNLDEYVNELDEQMSNLQALNFADLKKQNDEQYNQKVVVPLTDTVGVEVNINPSVDIIEKIIRGITEIITIESLDLTEADEAAKIQFILAVLIKNTTNINCQATSFADYMDLILQLTRAKFIKLIMEGYGDNLERILLEITSQMNDYTEILNITQKKTLDEINNKKRTASSKKNTPRKKKQKEEVNSDVTSKTSERSAEATSNESDTSATE